MASNTGLVRQQDDGTQASPYLGATGTVAVCTRWVVPTEGLCHKVRERENSEYTLTYYPTEGVTQTRCPCN